MSAHGRPSAVAVALALPLPLPLRMTVEGDRTLLRKRLWLGRGLWLWLWMLHGRRGSRRPLGTGTKNLCGSPKKDEDEEVISENASNADRAHPAYGRYICSQAPLAALQLPSATSAGSSEKEIVSFYTRATASHSCVTPFPPPSFIVDFSLHSPVSAPLHLLRPPLSTLLGAFNWDHRHGLSLPALRHHE